MNAHNSSRVPMTESVALYYSCEILLAVATLHHCGIIHADIKPDNFLLKDIRYIPVRMGRLYS